MTPLKFYFSEVGPFYREWIKYREGGPQSDWKADPKVFQTINFVVQTLPNDSVKGSLNILGLHTHPNRIKIMNTNEMIEDLKHFLMK